MCVVTLCGMSAVLTTLCDRTGLDVSKDASREAFSIVSAISNGFSWTYDSDVGFPGYEVIDLRFCGDAVMVLSFPGNVKLCRWARWGM